MNPEKPIIEYAPDSTANPPKPPYPTKNKWDQNISFSLY